jgi:hypothetical protein
MRGIPWLAQDLLASQEWLCSVELVLTTRTGTAACDNTVGANFEALSGVCPIIRFFWHMTFHNCIFASWRFDTASCHLHGIRLNTGEASYPRRIECLSLSPFRRVFASAGSTLLWDIASRLRVHVPFVQNCCSKSTAPTHVWAQNIRAWSQDKVVWTAV